MAASERLLAIPIVYDTYQWMIGAPGCHARFISEMVCPLAGERILDLGCGVGASAKFLPDNISYVGLDVSSEYIEMARRRYGNKRKFICADVTSIDEEELGTFDRAFCFGVLHHLSDSEVFGVKSLIQKVVRPGGKFVTIDPCYENGQAAIAKFLIDHDRGAYVRSRAGFEHLLAGIGSVQSHVYHDLLRIPYTQIVMQLTVSK